MSLDISLWEDNEADHGESEAKSDEWESQSSKVRCKSKEKQHDRSSDIGSNRVQICFDCCISKTFDNDREEKRYGL